MEAPGTDQDKQAAIDVSQVAGKQGTGSSPKIDSISTPKSAIPSPLLNEQKQRSSSIDSNSANGTRTRTRTSSAVRERGNSLMGNELVKEAAIVEAEEGITADQSIDNAAGNESNISSSVQVVLKEDSPALPEIVKPKFFKETTPPVSPALSEKKTPAQQSSASLSASPIYAAALSKPAKSSPLVDQQRKSSTSSPKKPAESPSVSIESSSAPVQTPKQQPVVMPEITAAETKLVQSEPATKTTEAEKKAEKEEKSTESALNKSSASNASGASANPNDKGAKPKPKTDPMMRIFKLLWPFSWGMSKKDKETSGPESEASVGRFELITIFLVSCLRTWHQDRMVSVKRDLMMATFTRNSTLFHEILKQTAILSILSSVIFALHRYLKEKLTLAWRSKLTRQLHRKYFDHMASYKLSHMNQGKIPDVEERITKDTRRFARSLADEMEKMSAALTSGVWFTYKLTTISSLPFAISPLIYFYAAYLVTVRIAPNWSERFRVTLDKKGIYSRAQSRLQSHAEAICAYQGNEQERRIIDSLWADFLAYGVDFVKDASLFQFVSTAFFEYGAHSFAETLIVGKFISASAPEKARLLAATTQAEKMAATAALFSQVRFLTEYFIRAMSSQGTVIAVMQQLQNMKGPARRLTELYDTLESFAEKRKLEKGSRFASDPDTIAFDDVQVYTPTGHLLVKDLTFKIRSGTNMLLTGVNGSGKSSIFRCLGALWSIPSGVITKPGGSEEGLNSAVFYLPQKPYNVLGTMRDQLCYPASHEQSRAITRDEMKDLLEEVDLGYLMDRKTGIDDDTEVNWESVLSLGEKQRLAMARLFFHGPKFAILDECTSGVSASMERRLYETCERRGITCITISHRPVLEQYHDVVLNILGDGKGGWSWRETGRNKMRRQESLHQQSMAAKSTTSNVSDGSSEVGGYSARYNREESALVERDRLSQRSSKYKDSKLSEHKTLRKVGTRKRMQDLLDKFAPQGWTLDDPENRRVLFLAFMIVCKTFLADGIARYDGYIISCVLENSWLAFAAAVAKGAFFRTFLALFDAMMMRQKWYLNLEWRRRLTKYLMDLYFTRNTFYDIKNHDNRIPDPEERLSDQIEELTNSLTELWTSLLKPAFDIGFNSIMLYRTLGAAGVAYTSGYMLVGLAFMRFLIPNFRQLRRVEFDLEGRFRFVHNRLVNHTESIAFFGGDDVEHEIAEKRYAALEKHINETQWQTFRFNIFNNFSIKQMPDLVAFYMRMYFAEHFGSDSAVMKDGGSVLANQGEYIQQTVMRSFRSFGEAFDLQETIGQFFGVLENVTDFMYVLEEIVEDQNHKEAGDSGKLLPALEDGAISFEHVDIVAPGNICLQTDLNFKVKPGEPLIVTGPNASGKSSLFRVLGGLWPIPTGIIRRPCDPKDGEVHPKQVFLVPQKPYSVTGSLADQITYPDIIPPEKRTAEDEEKFMDLMKLVRVPYLVEREGGWDAKAKWEDTLSLGEQQRIGCARLFYHQPQFAVLDECTSAVSIDVEEALYRAAHERGITSITISQRLALEKFHNAELRMGDCEGENGWSLHPIDHSKKE